MLFDSFISGMRGRLLAVAASILVLTFAGNVAARDSTPSEYELKAAFIYKFAKFVDWPPQVFPSPDTPLVLAVLGDDDSSKDMEAIGGRAIGSHPIKVERVRIGTNLPPCQILVILRSARQGAPAMLEAARTRSILTIGDGLKEFAESGAIINLINSPDGKIRFEINVDAAKRANLKIESPLLNLAKIIRDNRPAGP